MSKRNSIISLVVTVLALAGLAYVALIGFGPTGEGAAKNIKQGLDLAGGVSITYQVKGEENPSQEDMSDTVYKLQKRVEQYSTESLVYQEGSSRINIDIPGVSDANTILNELGRPGSLYFISETDSEGNLNYEMTVNEVTGAFGYNLNKTIEELAADGSIILDGTQVQTATAGQMADEMQNMQFVVQLTFTDEGTTAFAEATERAFAQGESIAIYYDSDFVSVPNVQSVINDGEAQITGMADFETAETLASTIRIGGLKLELEELRSNVVGAQLGEEAIESGILAGVVGICIIIVFMTVIYLLPGFVASISLLIYVGLTMLCLNAFDITLTLPGIAGIILSIGMAVDANVIIYARIKEEIGSGKTVQSAIKIGFQKAASAIVDGNITTLIAALVLGLRGSGSVKGFAQTLAIGIILSMFTAFFVSRFIIKAFYGIGLKNEKLYGSIKERKPINFLSKKFIFIGISLGAMILGFVFMGVNKQSSLDAVFNYSMEFKGGTSTNVTFNEDYSIADIDARIVPVVSEITGDGDVQTQKVAGTNEVIIKTRTLSVDEREQFNRRMIEEFQIDPNMITAETISATVSSEMRADAVIAVVIAIVCMLIYIWFRFKDVRFAASAVLALINDVMIVIGFYAIARVTVGGTFIACVLTILGYSINATIVIFDRIRENLAMMPTKTDEDTALIVNTSITQTLTRSIYTTVTTAVMVASLYIFGVTGIREFALPLLVGIIYGVYSSVCITGAIWYLMRTKIKKKETQK